MWLESKTMNFTPFVFSFVHFRGSFIFCAVCVEHVSVSLVMFGGEHSGYRDTEV